MTARLQLGSQSDGRAAGAGSGQGAWCCDPLVAGFVLLCYYKWLCFPNAFNHFYGAQEYQD